MRRWFTALALSTIAGVTLSACGNPAGVDGTLTDDWPELAVPQPFVPAAEVCHDTGFVETTTLAAYGPVDCGGTHQLETVHVGVFAGAAADRTAPPARDSPEIRGAYTECDGKAREYIGDDWRHGRLWLGVALPATTAWTSGARWFRCDVREVTNVEQGRPVSREASLRDALKGPTPPLRLTCYAVKLTGTGTVKAVPPADCDKQHNGEFVGVWRAPTDLRFPVRDGEWARFYTECYTVLAAYVGVPVDRDLRARSAVIIVPPVEKDWRAGDRGVRCYLWLDDATVARSLKGVGTAGLPIRHR